MYESETYQNMPNLSMMNAMYSTTFGNGSFQVIPPNPGEIGQGFPSVPYFSIEAIFYQQQASNPSTSPVNTMSGSNIGQQVINGQQTISDGTNTSRFMTGTQQQNG